MPVIPVLGRLRQEDLKTAHGDPVQKNEKDHVVKGSVPTVAVLEYRVLRRHELIPSVYR